MLRTVIFDVGIRVQTNRKTAFKPPMHYFTMALIGKPKYVTSALIGCKGFLFIFNKIRRNFSLCTLQLFILQTSSTVLDKGRNYVQVNWCLWRWAKKKTRNRCRSIFFHVTWREKSSPLYHFRWDWIASRPIIFLKKINVLLIGIIWREKILRNFRCRSLWAAIIFANYLIFPSDLLGGPGCVLRVVFLLPRVIMLRGNVTGSLW